MEKLSNSVTATSTTTSTTTATTQTPEVDNTAKVVIAQLQQEIAKLTATLNDLKLGSQPGSYSYMYMYIFDHLFLNLELHER